MLRSHRVRSNLVAGRHGSDALKPHGVHSKLVCLFTCMANEPNSERLCGDIAATSKRAGNSFLAELSTPMNARHLLHCGDGKRRSTIHSTWNRVESIYAASEMQSMKSTKAERFLHGFLLCTGCASPMRHRDECLHTEHLQLLSAAVCRPFIRGCYAKRARREIRSDDIVIIKRLQISVGDQSANMKYSISHYYWCLHSK